MQDVYRNRLAAQGLFGAELFDEVQGGFGVRAWLEDVDLSFPNGGRVWVKAKLSAEVYKSGWFKHGCKLEVDAEFVFSIENGQVCGHA